MMIANTRNFWLFNTHVFLRQLFQALSVVGSVYLYLTGVPLELILLTMFSFRLGETLLMPYAHKIYCILGWKLSIFIGIIAMAIYIFSYSLVEHSLYYLIFLAVFGIIYDLLYWPARTNLQRNTVSDANVSRGIGINSAINIIGSAGGSILLALALHYYESIVFVFCAIGLLISFIPLMFIQDVQDEKLIKEHDFSKFSLWNIGKFLKNNDIKIISLIIFIAIISEVTELIFPLFLALNNLEIKDVGLVIGLFHALNALSSIFIGQLEYRNNNWFIYLSCISAICVVLAYHLNTVDETWFILLFSIASTPIFTSVLCKSQNYVLENYGKHEGGFIIQFVDNGARILMYPVFYFLFSGGYTHHLPTAMGITLICLLVCIFAVNFIISKKEKRAPNN